MIPIIPRSASFVPRTAPPNLLVLLSLLPPLIALAFLLAGAPAQAGDTPSRLERQLRLVERAIDDMLVESPNFLVAGSRVTESIDDEEGGALFLFEASLTGADRDRRFSFRNLRWESGESSIIVLKDTESGDQDETIQLDEAEITVKDGQVTIRGKDGKKVKVLKLDRRDLDQPTGQAEAEDSGSKDAARERQVAKYERAREELIAALMDYGELLEALPPGSPVRIVARLADTGLPKDRAVRKLSVRASIDDLRAYGDGKLSESEMRARVQVRES